MTRREIFYLVSLACLGLFILLGTYLWKESTVNSKEMELKREYYASQADNQATPENGELQSQPDSKGNVSSMPGSPPVNPKANTLPDTATSTSPTSVAPAATPSKAPNPMPISTTQNNIIVPGCKVGDKVLLGDVELVVTKTTETYKVIDITIKGNTSGQPPKPVLVDQNRIVYEIPADVEINIDLTDKTTIDKSPIFYDTEK